MQDEKAKKKRGGNHNPTGKGGLKDNPQNRNTAGQRSAAVVSFGRGLRELLVTVGEEVTTLPDGRKISKIEGVVRAAYRQAIEGDANARTFIAERVEGKVAQKIDVRDLSDQQLIAALAAIGDGEIES